MLPPETTLQNRYRIIRMLGQGGMGTIYEAVDSRVNAVVALKETNVATPGQSRREFEREAGLLANLHHRALPQVMDYFIEGNGEYLVMEYIEGYDLLEMLKRRGAPFEVELVLKWADDVLDVLEYLHKRQPPVLHRDIKPANLKLTQNDELFLLDFGLAKGAAGQMATLLTSRSARGYTPVYAPLEQIIGQGTDQRSDLYSLGATLYHLLAGVPPTDAATRYELIENGQPDPLLPLSNLNPKVPPGIAATIHQAMAIQRKDRFDSAAVMRQALNRAREKARRPPEIEQREEEEQQQPTLAALPPWQTTGREPYNDEAAPQRFAQQPIAQQPIPYAPRRRIAPFVIIAATIFTVAAIVLVIALTRRTVSEDKSAADKVSTASPQPSATTQSSTTVATPTPVATQAKTITENINGVPLEMVLVPAGTFTMGSPAGEGADDERPQHTVTVQAFYMGKYEVTQEQYKAVMGDDPSDHQGNKLPVENVSWKDAIAFCARLSRLTGRVYRLPTEAEWEYACRGGTKTVFAFGNSISSDQANFDGRSPYGGAPVGPYLNETTPGGSYRPNKFGLYDMHGNIWEWCQDIYHSSYVGAPMDGAAWLEGSGDHVVRGGSWLSNGGGVRSAVRDRLDANARFAFIGFRVVATTQ
jgi:formylglycine-generating enzyme required for sulfatase activity